MIALTFNKADFLHDLEGHVENSQRTKVIIEEIEKIQNSFQKVENSLVENSFIENSSVEKSFKIFSTDNLTYENYVEDILKTVHNLDYLNFLRDSIKKIKKIGFLDSDTYITAYSWDVVLTNLDLLFKTVDWIIDNRTYGFAYIRPPGHHAESSKAMGFCLINNVAVLAKYIQLSSNKKKVMIVDFDAHHGNGTQEIFYDDDTVLYFSTHAFPFYPFTGNVFEKGNGKGYGYNYNFPVSVYASDDDLLEIYEKEFPKVFNQFQCDFLIVSSGYDIHSHDPITYMNCSTSGIKKIKDLILKVANYQNVIFVLEGGYNLNVLREVVRDDLNRVK